MNKASWHTPRRGEQRLKFVRFQPSLARREICSTGHRALKDPAKFSSRSRG
ncbi:MAG: hypothetical protein L0229_13485 [Blastocatellia bacterium]|nr:hypothetical protein [Blastocatellia bacterium]